MSPIRKILTGFCKMCGKEIGENDEMCRCNEEQLYRFVGGDIVKTEDGTGFECSKCGENNYTMQMHMHLTNEHIYNYICSCGEGLLVVQNEKAGDFY